MWIYFNKDIKLVTLLNELRIIIMSQDSFSNSIWFQKLN